MGGHHPMIMTAISSLQRTLDDQVIRSDAGCFDFSFHRKDFRNCPTNGQTQTPMKPITKILRQGYQLLVTAGNRLQSAFLLILRVYFFGQLFMTGQGHLAHIGKVTEFFMSLGIPFPTLNAYLSSAVECFGSFLLIIGLLSRLTAIPVAVTMVVAYLTADLEAVTSIFSDPDKFVKADPFPYFLSALVVLAFGPGRFSIDALIKGMFGRPRRSGDQKSQFWIRVQSQEV